MKKLQLTIFTIFILISIPLSAKELPISSQLNKFSPFGEIFIRSLGMEDKNANGTIDKGAGEGYEQFIQKYGNADKGFYINCTTQGANNGKLEENEIINHYYTNIRFNPGFEKETSSIEREVNFYIYANNIPLVWLDDKQGTVMNTVNNILGSGWQNKKYTESETIKTLENLSAKLNMRGLSGLPHTTGYDQMPDFITRKAGYCFEVAQLQFWFFSKLGISSSVVVSTLTPSLTHGVIRLNKSGRIIDHFGVSAGYKVPNNQWVIMNPVQSIAEYYIGQARSRRHLPGAEKSVIHNKYDISNMVFLMDLYADSPYRNHEEIIALGEFVLANTNISGMMASADNIKETIKDNFAYILSILVESYSATGNHSGFNNAERLLNQYYGNDPKVKRFLDRYRF